MAATNATTLLQFAVLLLICSCLGVCVAMDKITITRPLKDIDTVVSLNQTFKLGFFSPPNTTHRYVGIMFNVPVSTVIWVANRDKPLNDTAGTFAVLDGNLVVLNGEKEILWSSNVSNSLANCTAQLLDTGNLVLQGNGRVIWESFQNPADSFVNTMRMSEASVTNEKLRLRSWRSPSDPFIGDFSIGLEILQTAQIFIWNRSKRYWRSGPWDGTLFIGVPIMNSVYNNGFDLVRDGTESAYLSLRYSNGFDLTSRKPTYTNNSSALLYYQLTSEGNLLEKIWHEEKGDWEVTASLMETKCDIYGKCGPFGSCNSQESPICSCLKGFQPRDKEEWDNGNWTGGCTRKKPLQCGRSITAGLDGYVKLAKMKVPDFAELKSNSEENCDSLCLESCSCVAYAYYEGIGCMHWSGSLTDIQQFQSGGADLYIRVSRSELATKKDMTLVIASTIVVGSLVLASSAYVCWKLLAKYRGKKQEPEQSLFQAMDAMGRGPTNNSKQATLEELPLFTYESLANATGLKEAETKSFYRATRV